MSTPAAQVRTERSRRAVDAAVAVAREHGLRVDEPVVLADLFSVMVHLKPALVVARVSTWTSKLRQPIEDWLRREIEVTGFLVDQGLPVIGPSPELPPGPHTYDGFGINFWTYVRPEPDRTATMADCSAMLVDLHAGLRKYPGELPVLAPARNDLPYGLAALDQAGDLLSPARIARIREIAESFRQDVEAPAGVLQPLHGDVHPNNLIPTRDGFMWIDFEDVCLGPVEWDLAMMAMFGGGTELTEQHALDPDRLRAYTRLRALHVALCLIAYRPDLGDLPDWDEGIGMFLAGVDAGV